MKRRDFERYLREHGCRFDHEGAKHSVFVHDANRKNATVPRHDELNDIPVAAICKQLGILWASFRPDVDASRFAIFRFYLSKEDA